MKLKDISPENRPRERLSKFGVGILSDAELLALILKTGSRNQNAIDLAHTLISKHGLERLSFCSLKELVALKGVGTAKASQILAVFELARRASHSLASSKPILNAKDVYEYLSPKLSNLKQEHFVVLHLDSKNKVVREETVFIGSLNSSVIHPREIFKSAIRESANTIILAHNHPSGDVEPSDEDNIITEKMFESGKILGIKVLDHVIVGGTEYYSFKERRMNIFEK